MNGEEPVTSNVTDAPPALAVEIFKCKKCGREFGKAQALQTHEIRAHKKFWSTNTPAKKSGRPRTVGNNRYEKYRDRYHAQGLNAKGKPYKNGRGAASLECPVCHKSFASRTSLGSHVRVTHKRSMKEFLPRELECPMCRRRFAGAGNLGMHMSRVHGQTLAEYRNGETPTPKGRAGRPKGSRSKQCPVCKKKYTTRALMTHHVRTVHGKSITEFQERGGGPLAPAPGPSESPRPVKRTPVKEGREVIFCPVCGTNIHAVRTAVNFAEQ